MKLRSKCHVFCACLFIGTASAFASVPPEYVEPTREKMRSLGFKFAIKRHNGTSSIYWRFPGTVRDKAFTLVPFSTEIVVSDLAGNVIARTTNWISDNQIRALDATYHHKVADVSVEVSYACGKRSAKGCYGATTFRIPSVSTFIQANPDALNLRPTCRKVTDMIVDCTRYESAEHP